MGGAATHWGAGLGEAEGGAGVVGARGGGQGGGGGVVRHQVHHIVYVSLEHGGNAGLCYRQGEAGHGVVLPVSQVQGGGVKCEGVRVSRGEDGGDCGEGGEEAGKGDGQPGLIYLLQVRPVDIYGEPGGPPHPLHQHLPYGPVHGSPLYDLFQAPS